ncbi:hypothetical protein BJ742DRAFT_734384 [Cladochytrium replicatum]|nr:hypothetical protein BJ742DRAFT_734384 [Cladochytrium replicatum]
MRTNNLHVVRSPFFKHEGALRRALNDLSGRGRLKTSVFSCENGDKEVWVTFRAIAEAELGMSLFMLWSTLSGGEDGLTVNFGYGQGVPTILKTELLKCQGRNSCNRIANVSRISNFLIIQNTAFASKDAITSAVKAWSPCAEVKFQSCAVNKVDRKFGFFSKLWTTQEFTAKLHGNPRNISVRYRFRCDVPGDMKPDVVETEHRSFPDAGQAGSLVNGARIAQPSSTIQPRSAATACYRQMVRLPNALRVVSTESNDLLSETSGAVRVESFPGAEYFPVPQKATVLEVEEKNPSDSVIARNTCVQSEADLKSILSRWARKEGEISGKLVRGIRQTIFMQFRNSEEAMTAHSPMR